MTTPISNRREHFSIQGCLRAASSTLASLAHRVDRCIASMIAKLGSWFHWESLKWAGFKVDPLHLPPMNLKFDELSTLGKIERNERGGFFKPHILSNLDVQLPSKKQESVDPTLSAFTASVDSSQTQESLTNALSTLVTAFHAKIDAGTMKREEIQNLVTPDIQNKLKVALQALINTVQNEIGAIEGGNGNYRYFLAEPALSLFLKMHRGIECGLLNSEIVQTPLHRLDLRVKVERLIFLAIRHSAIDSKLWDWNDILIRFYEGADRTIRSNGSANLFISSLFLGSGEPKNIRTKEDFKNSPEWTRIQLESTCYKQIIQNIIRRDLVDETSKEDFFKGEVEGAKLDGYLLNTKHALQCGLIDQGEFLTNETPRSSAYLRAARWVFLADNALHWRSGTKMTDIFNDFIRRLSDGLWIGVMDDRATTLQDLATKCFKRGEVSDNWKNSKEGKTLLEQIKLLVPR
jgi:hypothetical protein